MYKVLGKDFALGFDIGHLETALANVEKWFDEDKANRFLNGSLSLEDFPYEDAREVYKLYMLLADFIKLVTAGINPTYCKPYFSKCLISRRRWGIVMRKMK